jgi:acid phosphatase type 7
MLSKIDLKYGKYIDSDREVVIMHRTKPVLKILCVVVGVYMTLSVLDCALFAKASRNDTPTDLPYDIHLNWQHNSSTTMTIIWETTILTTGSTVKYGLDTNYNQTITGMTDNQGTNGLIHIVEITGLPAGITYHYICGDDTGGWSTDSTFMTAPAGTADFVFCAMGDSRDNPSEFNKIVNKANTVDPTFTVFTGDLCGSDNKNDYDQWFSNWEQLGDHSPIAPALGNHDGNATNYLHRFALPNNERWYSFNYSSIHIIVLSTSVDDYSQGSAQYTWFVHDLKTAANDSTHPWKIVNFHNPPYNVGGHGGNSSVQSILSPLLSQYKVDLVFNGHNHYYERTYPLKGGGTNPTVTDTNLHYYKNPDGVIYATTGSCGAPLYDVGSAYYLAVAQKTYHFAKISVFSNNSLHMETFLDDGTTLIDVFWIEKTTGQNLPPEAPLIDGLLHGKSGVAYQYTFNATDPNGDNVSYLIDWGDNTSSGWIGPYLSGDEITESHSWSKKGTYTIKAKAKDMYGNEGEWGTLSVTMPKETASIPSPFLKLIERFMEQFPHTFPLLRQLWGYWKIPPFFFFYLISTKTMF